MHRVVVFHRNQDRFHAHRLPDERRSLSWQKRAFALKKGKPKQRSPHKSAYWFCFGLTTKKKPTTTAMATSATMAIESMSICHSSLGSGKMHAVQPYPHLRSAKRRCGNLLLTPTLDTP